MYLLAAKEREVLKGISRKRKINLSNLCSQIEMYLENDLPLVVKYNVASLGDIKLCLAPLPSSNK